MTAARPFANAVAHGNARGGPSQGHDLRNRDSPPRRAARRPRDHGTPDLRFRVRIRVLTEACAPVLADRGGMPPQHLVHLATERRRYEQLVASRFSTLSTQDAEDV